MKDYYYLTALDSSPYNLTMADALHLGATGKLPTYVYLTDHVMGEQTTCKEANATEPNPCFYIGDTPIFNESRVFSLKFVKIPMETLVGLEKATADRVVMECGQLDHHSDGKDPVSIPFHDARKWPHEPLFFRFSDGPLQITRNDVLFFVDDLEKLASHGTIQRRDTEDTSTAAATQTDNGNDSAELRRTRRTLAALANGLAVKHPVYRHGEKVNVKALADVATEHLRDENGRTPYGFSDKTARDTIAKALKASLELTDHSDKAG